MNFKASKGIFLQLADNLCNEIIRGVLPVGERIPSVRQLAADFEVNQNTVLRTYGVLEEHGIIENRRGIGFFVTEDAIEKIKAYQKEEFFEDELPPVIQKIKLLKIRPSELKELLDAIRENEEL